MASRNDARFERVREALKYLYDYVSYESGAEEALDAIQRDYEAAEKVSEARRSEGKRILDERNKFERALQMAARRLNQVERERDELREALERAWLDAYAAGLAAGRQEDG